jgi:hypothetical protein
MSKTIIRGKIIAIVRNYYIPICEGLITNNRYVIEEGRKLAT